MNRFIALSCLLAVAAAEADPWYGVYGAYAHPALVSPHAIGASGQTVSVEAATAGHLAAKPYLYGLPYAHYIGKREAEAEPKADADPWYGVYGAYGVSPHAIGVTGQTVSVEAAAAGHLATKAAYYGYPYAHYIGKREAEAEAEPEADADPEAWYGAYGYGAYGAYAHPYGYGAYGVSPHAIGVTGQTVSVEAAAAGHLATKALRYGYPYGGYGHYGGYGGYGGYAGYRGYAGHYIGKRAAEAEADAKPWYGVYGYGIHKPIITSVGALTTYSNGAVTPTNTLAVQQATAAHLAAKAGVYAAHGYPYYHALGKRSAEAEADPYYLGYGYGLTHPVTSLGALTTYANGAVVPHDPAGLAATSAHLASKGLHGVPAYGYLWG